MNDNNPTRVHIYSRVPRRPLTYLRLEQYQKRDTQPSRNYGGHLLDGSHSRGTTSFYALATVISHRRRFTKFTRYFNPYTHGLGLWIYTCSKVSGLCLFCPITLRTTAYHLLTYKKIRGHTTVYYINFGINVPF